MAQKRMFSLNVVDTDNFLEMPISSRLLYYELGMRADDDGFVSNWKKILAFTGLKEDDLKVLIAKKYIIPFDSGVIVIRHWRMNNYLRNDRFNPTQYQKELSELDLDENNIYNMDTVGIPGGIHSIDKYSIDKNRIEYKKKKFKKPTLKEIENYIKEKNMNVNAKTFYDYFETSNWVDSKGNKVKNWKLKLITWNSYGKDKKQEPIWFDKNIKNQGMTEREKKELENLLNDM